MCRPCALQTIGEKKGAHPHIHIHIYLFAYVFNTAAASHPLSHGLFLPSSPFFSCYIHFDDLLSHVYPSNCCVCFVQFVLVFIWGAEGRRRRKNRMIVVRYTYKHYASMRWLRNVWRRVGEWGKKQQQQQHIQSYNVNASMLCWLAESKQRQNEMKKKTLTN